MLAQLYHLHGSLHLLDPKRLLLCGQYEAVTKQLRPMMCFLSSAVSFKCSLAVSLHFGFSRARAASQPKHQKISALWTAATLHLQAVQWNSWTFTLFDSGWWCPSTNPCAPALATCLNLERLLFFSGKEISSVLLSGNGIHSQNKHMSVIRLCRLGDSSP